MTSTETNRDKQSEPRLLTRAELEAVAGGDSGTAAGVHALCVLCQYAGHRPVPPPPDPCRD
jgi:hypothetical protein